MVTCPLLIGQSQTFVSVTVTPEAAATINALKQNATTNYRQEGWNLVKNDHRLNQATHYLGLQMISDDHKLAKDAQQKHNELMHKVEADMCQCSSDNESESSEDVEGDDVLPGIGDQTTINYHEAPKGQDEIAALRAEIARLQQQQQAPQPMPAPAQPQPPVVKAAKKLGPVALSMLTLGTGLGGAGIVATGLYQGMKAMKPDPAQVKDTNTDTAIRLFPDRPVMPSNGESK